MKYRRRGRMSSEVNASSLNDIMFFLLLFFLIVSTLVNPSVIKLLLPKASNGQTLSKQQITISVTKDLQYYIDNTPVTFDNLESQLSQKVSTIPNATVVVRADKELQLQDVVNILEIGNRLKVKMILATTNK
jgi:biopolymer transport protein ExbD